MAKKGINRSLVTLKCSECGNETKRVSKNKRNTTERLELNKHCKTCRKHTVQKEKK